MSTFRNTTTLPRVDRLLWRARQVGDSLEFGRSKTYALIAGGEIPSVRIGRSVRVPVEALRAWVKRRSRAGAGRAIRDGNRK